AAVTPLAVTDFVHIGTRVRSGGGRRAHHGSQHLQLRQPYAEVRTEEAGPGPAGEDNGLACDSPPFRNDRCRAATRAFDAAHGTMRENDRPLALCGSRD